MGIANATAGNATVSTTGSAADATVDATVDATAGNFPASPITAATGSAEATAGNPAASTTAFIAEAATGLFQAFRSLRCPCDDNLYNIGSPRLEQHGHCDWQRLLDCIVGGFGCNENNCAGLDKHRHRRRPSLTPPLRKNIRHRLVNSDDMNLLIEKTPCTQVVCRCN
jgi:hypothetical protein